MLTKDDALLAALTGGPDTASLNDRQRALVDYALKLTLIPQDVREEDLVLRREVAVDRAGTVFDLRGDVADGDLGVAVGDEQLERGIEDRTPRDLTGVLLAFFSAHVS